MFLPVFVCLSVCLSLCEQDYSNTPAVLHGFGSNVACRPMSGHGRTEEVMNGFNDEILCVNSCGGLHKLIRFWAGSGSDFGSWNRIYTGFFNFSGICEKVMDRFRWNFMRQ